MKVLLAALIGGIVMFAWGAVAHTWTPLKSMGMTALPKEDAVLDELKGAIRAPGLYVYPGFDAGKDATKEQESALDEKRKQGPIVFLAYNPRGVESTPDLEQMGLELASNIIAALLAALILSKVGNSLASRIFFSILIGAVGWLSISASECIWHNFSEDYTLAAGIIQGIGWAVSGLAMALCLQSGGGKKK